MEQPIAIGLVLNEIRKKKKVSTQELASFLGMTTQGIYDTFNKRVKMPYDDLKKWAEALEVDVQTIIDKSEGKTVEISKSKDSGVFGDEVLQTIKMLLEKELNEKNEQIRALQEALRESQQMSLQAQQMTMTLLGKLRESSNLIVIPGQQFGRAPIAFARS